VEYGVIYDDARLSPAGRAFLETLTATR
jgi:hypothetical protein